MMNKKAYFHLPGMFEYFELYKRFLPIFREHSELFYDLCEIGSIYDAPFGCIWGGGRIGNGEEDPEEVLRFLQEYEISARLTFSNSLLREEHLSDKKCNSLCELCEKYGKVKNGIIVHSDLLLDYLREKYPGLYFVSSTTKVITDFNQFVDEVQRSDFDYVVPDFRLNKRFDELRNMPQLLKNKVEFLCNECCYFGCSERKICYENVSSRILGDDVEEFQCKSPNAHEGYVFSGAMENPGFIGINDIQNVYLPMGFSNFKIEGRDLGSALVLEFLLYYLVKPEYHLRVREMIYLDSMLDLF